MLAVVDTGPLYAVVDEDDADHGRCRALIETIVTLDDRHFHAVRPRHRQAFRLLP